ncbi:MAG: hypothetical protein ACOYK8_02710 [Alphaproteobacteria bacterium]
MDSSAHRLTLQFNWAIITLSNHDFVNGILAAAKEITDLATNKGNFIADFTYAERLQQIEKNQQQQAELLFGLYLNQFYDRFANGITVNAENPVDLSLVRSIDSIKNVLTLLPDNADLAQIAAQLQDIEPPLAKPNNPLGKRTMYPPILAKIA